MLIMQPFGVARHVLSTQVGAADGGLQVPRKIKNFFGHEAAEIKGDEAKYEAEARSPRSSVSM